MNDKARNKRNHRRRKRSNQARRLAVYLDSAGVQPVCSGRNWEKMILSFTLQYMLLPEEQRDRARAQGEERIRKNGLRLAAANLLPWFTPESQGPQREGGPAKCRQKCPHCRTYRFKTIWESMEAAERFCADSGDTGLGAYECPYGYGWHAGHLRKHAGGGTGFGDSSLEEKKGGILIESKEAHPQSVEETLSNE